MSSHPRSNEHRRFGMPTIQEVLALREENHLKPMAQLLRLRHELHEKPLAELIQLREDSLRRVGSRPRRGTCHG